MSMTEEEYAYEEYMAEMYEEHKKEAIEEFTYERLQSYYSENKLLAKPAFHVFAEAKDLIGKHTTAGFVFAAIAVEVGLKDTLLKPIVFGLVHTTSTASLITNLVMSHQSMDRYKELLLQILREHGGFDLHSYKRQHAVRPIWEEIKNIQKKRNLILHAAAEASVDEATLALDVASEILEDIFPTVLTSMGMHLHDRYRICDDWECK